MTIKERPIIFSGPMVNAIINGKKTQTRRAKNIPQNAIAAWIDDMAWRFDLPGELKMMVRCPYGVVGDRLWVRETLKSGPLPNPCTGEPTNATVALYAADDEWLVEERRFNLAPWWKHWIDGRKLPSIHMPRWASRVTLEITDVRVQRVQDISEEDIIAEGCPPEFLLGVNWFRPLWDSINGPGAWERNNLVWALTFRKVTG